MSAGVGFALLSRFMSCYQASGLEGPGKGPGVREGSLKEEVCSSLLVGMIKTF